MAGGSSFQMRGKRDRLESWKVNVYESDGVTVKEIQLWERKSVEIDIVAKIRADGISFGGGDLGKTSSSITASVGSGIYRRTVSRSFSQNTPFICTRDEVVEEQPFSDWYLYEQTWVATDKDKKTGTETPEE